MLSYRCLNGRLHHWLLHDWLLLQHLGGETEIEGGFDLFRLFVLCGLAEVEVIKEVEGRLGLLLLSGHGHIAAKVEEHLLARLSGTLLGH